MKMKLWLCLLLLFTAACGSQNEVATELNLDIQLRIEPENPSVGLSTLLIEVRDENAEAISDAQITVIGNMSHEGMGATEANGSRAENGVYRIPFEWTMGGDWYVDVTVTLASNAGVVQKRFEVFVNAASENSIIHQVPNSEGN
jgi:hypothetical protein